MCISYHRHLQIIHSHFDLHRGDLPTGSLLLYRKTVAKGIKARRQQKSLPSHPGTPPAPSPKMIHVSLSSKSSIDVIVSTPITIITLYWPDSINFAPVSNAYKKPLQAALKSKAHAFSAFILFWTIAAVEGVG